MADTGRIYRRGDIYYIAYRWDGREYRESARSAQRGVAEHLLATRLRERRGSPPPADLTFDALAAWYLDDYIVRRLRTLDTARGRVANLRAVFGGWPATAITTEAIRDYQRRRRLVAAAAATVNRETSALSRMFHLAVRSRQLDERPVFPERLEENGPRQGFFEHAEYTAVRQQLPAPYQDVLDFAYYSGWRKREILDLRWDEVDESGGGGAAFAATVEDAGGPRAADLAADCGGVGPAAGDPAGGGDAGLSPRRRDGAGLADGLARGLPESGRAWAVAA